MNTTPKPDMASIIAGENAFQKGLTEARARGGPAAEIDGVIRDSTAAAPVLPNGDKLTRMTLGIQRLMQKRAGMPGAQDITELVLFFSLGPVVAKLFDDYDVSTQQWTNPETRKAYETLVREYEFMLDADNLDAVGEWVAAEVRRFFPSRAETTEPQATTEPLSAPLPEPAAAASDGGSAPSKTSVPTTGKFTPEYVDSVP